VPPIDAPASEPARRQARAMLGELTPAEAAHSSSTNDPGWRSPYVLAAEPQHHPLERGVELLEATLA
jgi:hypothetical protein